MSSEVHAVIEQVAGAPADIPEENIAHLFLEAVDGYQKPDAVRYKKLGAWHSLSHRQLYDDVKRLALGLEGLGVEQGDRVAILSENRPEWLISDFACVMSRAISVPLYPVLPADQIAYMLADSEAKVAFVSNAEQLEKIEALRGELPALRHVVSFEPPPSGAPAVSLSDLLAQGEARFGDRSDEEYRTNALGTDPQDVLSILYTSGTTGRPKGVMLTHNNLTSNVRAALKTFDVSDADVSLSVLPLCHIFERMAGHYVMFAAGVSVCYAESFDALGQNLVEVRPHIITLVPRVYEKLIERIEQVAHEGGPAKVKILRWARAVGAKHLEHRLHDRSVGPWLEIQYRLADRLVFSKLRARTGGRIRYFVSGAAPLSPDIAHFFMAAGMTILEGYGLTETSPGIAFNSPKANKLGTVGRPMEGVEVAIAEDGEILTRGPHVMKGYYKMPEATREAIEPDGWFHTGDIGALDEDGFLSIIDRKKELIVTAGGKNVAPAPIENRVVSHPYVNQVVMLGDRRKFPILLIVPNFDALEGWARAESITFANRDELVRDSQVISFMEGEVLGSLGDLARYERPKKVGMLARELTIDAGEITPTLKVRRRVVEEKYQEFIDSLYLQD